MNEGDTGVAEDCDVKVIVDGKEIDTNPFVKRVIVGVVGGCVEQLKGVEKGWNSIEVLIRR